MISVELMFKESK